MAVVCQNTVEGHALHRIDSLTSVDVDEDVLQAYCWRLEVAQVLNGIISEFHPQPYQSCVTTPELDFLHRFTVSACMNDGITTMLSGVQAGSLVNTRGASITCNPAQHLTSANQKRREQEVELHSDGTAARFA